MYNELCLSAGERNVGNIFFSYPFCSIVRQWAECCEPSWRSECGELCGSAVPGRELSSSYSGILHPIIHDVLGYIIGGLGLNMHCK